MIWQVILNSQIKSGLYSMSICVIQTFNKPECVTSSMSSGNSVIPIFSAMHSVHYSTHD